MRARNKIYILILITFGILCLALFATERVTNQRVLMRIGKIDLYDFVFIFLCLIGGGTISLLIRFARKTVRKFYRVLLLFCWVGIIGMMLFGSLLWFGDHAVTTWYEFYSPNNKYSLVVRESTFLLLCDVCPYERISSIFVRKLKADLSPDDGFAAISQGAYKISWDGDAVTLSVDMNQNGLWRVVKFNMAEHGKVLERFSDYPNGKPVSLDNQGETNTKDVLGLESDDSKPEDVQHGKVNQKIIEGLQAIALTTEYIAKENSEITYTAKGTPKLVLSSDLNATTYILYDRDSLNGKYALYVLYQSKNNGEGNLDPQIMEMYAYEYSGGRVIVADRHARSEVGTDEYREAIGE